MYIGIEEDRERAGVVVFGLPASDLHWQLYIWALVAGLVLGILMLLNAAVPLCGLTFGLGVLFGYLLLPSGADLVLTDRRIRFRRRWRTHALWLHEISGVRVREAQLPTGDRILEFRKHDGSWIEGPRFEEGQLGAQPLQIEAMLQAIDERIRANAARSGTEDDIPEALVRSVRPEEERR